MSSANAALVEGERMFGRQYIPLQDALEPLQIADSVSLTRQATHPVDTLPGPITRSKT